MRKDIKKDFGSFELKEFDIRLFFSRYLCGGVALKECRHISRKRLALANLNLIPDDIEANLLNYSILQYHKAVNDFSTVDKLGVEVLCQANKRFWQKGKRFGVIRKTQNGIGKSLKKISYTPPAPKDLTKLLEDVCKECNLYTGRQDKVNLIKIYARLIMIHPFSEGNGRTFRALYDSMSLSAQLPPIHLSLYRLGIDPVDYIQALQNIGVDSTNPIFSKYWAEAENWCTNLYEAIKIKLNEVIQKTDRKLMFAQVSENSKEIVRAMWKFPMATPNSLQKELGFNHEQLKSAMGILIQCKVISVVKLQHNESVPIFLCEDVFQAWEFMDEQIFNNKKEVK